jgi:hypothetical protein
VLLAWIAFEVGSDTWRDGRTGLRWTARDNDFDIGWESAREYCDRLSRGGFSDWRMPSIDELSGLYDPESSKEYKTRGRVELTSWWVWGADTKPDDPLLAAEFNFTSGGKSWRGRGNAGTIRVLCVRRSGG